MILCKLRASFTDAAISLFYRITRTTVAALNLPQESGLDNTINFLISNCSDSDLNLRDFRAADQ